MTKPDCSLSLSATPPTTVFTYATLQLGKQTLKLPSLHGADPQRFFVVDSVLFQVPVLALARQSIVFRAFFESVERPEAGMTADDPLWLPYDRGVTADAFEVFVCSLRQRPLPDAEDIPIEQLLYIAELSKQYLVHELLDWSTTAIISLTTSLSPAALELSSRILARLIILAHHIDSLPLFQCVQAIWCRRIHRRELPPRKAIGFADAFGLEELQKSAYYIQIVDMRLQYNHHDGELVRTAASTSIAGLSAVQLTHLRSGFHSLTAFWNTRIVPHPPMYAHSTACVNSELCIRNWAKLWKEALKKPMQDIVDGVFVPVGDADVVRKMRFMAARMKMAASHRDHVLAEMNEECVESALEAIELKAKEVVDSLLHHFDL